MAKKMNAVFVQSELFDESVYEESNKKLKEFYMEQFKDCIYVNPETKEKEVHIYVKPSEKILSQEEEEREIFGDVTWWEHKGKMQQDFFELQCEINKIEQDSKFQKAEEERIAKENAERELKKQIMDAREKIKDTLPHFENPKNDNEVLLNLQWDLFHGDESAWGKLLNLSLIVCKNLVRKHMKSQKMFLDEIEQDERSSIAMEYGLRRFNKTVGYCCTTNFITFFSDCVTHAMKYFTTEDTISHVESIREESRMKRITY